MANVVVKEGVEFRVIAKAGFRILRVLDMVAETCDEDLEITSASEDRGRLPTDPHATGEAFDVSVAGVAPEEILRRHQALSNWLGGRFSVLFEVKPGTVVAPSLSHIVYPSAGATAPHFHLQRKKGTVYPGTLHV